MLLALASLPDHARLTQYVARAQLNDAPACGICTSFAKRFGTLVGAVLYRLAEITAPAR